VEKEGILSEEKLKIVVDATYVQFIGSPKRPAEGEERAKSCCENRTGK